jgi:glutathione S-transferase
VEGVGVTSISDIAKRLDDELPIRQAVIDHKETPMALTLYAHPFSSYCQKVLIALYENNTPFNFRLVDFQDAQAVAELEALWSLKKFPVLTDDKRTLIEASIIIEYLDVRYPGATRFIPADANTALDVRFMDRFFDNYVMTPQQKIVFNALRQSEQRDDYGVQEARKQLDTAYRWLNNALADREWAAGDQFTLADCAAAPALFYADWSHPIDASCKNVHAYRQRLLARPSFARAVDEARPYRPLFPLGAPDRD